MGTQTTKEPLRQKVRAPVRKNEELAVSTQEPVHSQPVCPFDALQARIAKRAYEMYLERGCWSGYALSDWLEAEKEIRGSECNA